jgi:hypothetical protein
MPLVWPFCWLWVPMVRSRITKVWLCSLLFHSFIISFIYYFLFFSLFRFFSCAWYPHLVNFVFVHSIIIMLTFRHYSTWGGRTWIDRCLSDLCHWRYSGSAGQLSDGHGEIGDWIQTEIRAYALSQYFFSLSFFSATFFMCQYFISSIVGLMVRIECRADVRWIASVFDAWRVLPYLYHHRHVGDHYLSHSVHFRSGMSLDLSHKQIYLSCIIFLLTFFDCLFICYIVIYFFILRILV